MPHSLFSPAGSMYNFRPRVGDSTPGGLDSFGSRPGSSRGLNRQPLPPLGALPPTPPSSGGRGKRKHRSGTWFKKDPSPEFPVPKSRRTKKGRNSAPKDAAPPTSSADKDLPPNASPSASSSQSSGSNSSTITYRICGHLSNGQKRENLAPSEIHCPPTFLSKPTLCHACKSKWRHDPTMIPYMCETYAHLQRLLMEKGVWQPTSTQLQDLLQTARERHLSRFPKPPTVRTGPWTWSTPVWNKWDSLRALLEQERSKPVEKAYMQQDPLVWLFAGGMVSKSAEAWRKARSAEVKKLMQKAPVGTPMWKHRELAAINDALEEKEVMERREMKAKCEEMLRA